MPGKKPASDLHIKTGLTALFIFQKLLDSSSLKRFSASTAGFSSLSAEGERGGEPMRLGKKNEDKQSNARLLTPVLTVQQKI